MEAGIARLALPRTRHQLMRGKHLHAFSRQRMSCCQQRLVPAST